MIPLIAMLLAGVLYVLWPMPKEKVVLPPPEFEIAMSTQTVVAIPACVVIGSTEPEKVCGVNE